MTSERLKFNDMADGAWKHASHLSGFQTAKSGGSKEDVPIKAHKESWEAGWERAKMLDKQGEE